MISASRQTAPGLSYVDQCNHGYANVCFLQLCMQTCVSVVISGVSPTPNSGRAAVGFMTSQLIFSLYYRSHVPPNQ